MKYIYKKKYVRGLVTCLDLLGSIFKGGGKGEKRGVKKILLFKPDHIGDLLLATPFFRSLRRKYPKAHITLIVGEWGFEIVDGNPDIDRIFFFNAPWLSRGGWKSSWKEVPSLITLLKREKFDIYYCLRADLVGNMIGFFAKIPQRVGFTNGGGGFFLTVAFNEAVGVHQTSVLLQLLGDFKGASKTASPVLALSHKEREKANTILKRYNLFGKKLVGIHLGAGYPSKIWSVDKFGTLIRKVFLEYGYTPIVVGGRDDKLIARGIHEVLDECEGVVLAGEVNLKGTAALLERCSLFIGNDSGPAHIAGALGIPAVVIFSMANSPERWHPCGGQVSLVYKDVPCKGCERSVCSDKRCLDLITAEDVFSEVSKVMVL